VRAAPALLITILLALPCAARASTLPYPTTCAVELSRPLTAGDSGPICGTDEGDDVYFLGEPAAVQFFGENGHDTVAGSVFGDRIIGGGGNDELHGDRGDDALDGGDDSDVVFGGPGNDSLRERRFGFDTLFGGPGDDSLAGGRANDKLYGGTGNDVLYGGSGTDRLYGGPGDDTLYGGPNRDYFDCGPGNDTVYYSRRDAGPSSLERRDGFIPRAAGCERVIEGDPTATFPLRNKVATAGNDVMAGSDGPDLLEGKGGSDKLEGLAGDDELEGDGSSLQGDDTLIGGDGNDRLAGRAGDDRLFGDSTDGSGGPGNDELVGGTGRDLLVGGGGNDALMGAYDGDRVLAGAGNDVIGLLGGDTTDPNGTVYVDCGAGVDLVAINPARRGTYRNCEYYADQWHEADWGSLLRPSPEVFAGGGEPARAARDTSRFLTARRSAARHAHAAFGSDLTPVTESEPDGGVGPPSISFDGTRVGFSADAGNLIAADSNGERTDPFVRDLSTRSTVAVDAVRDRVAYHGGRFRRGPAGGLSADGRFAVFSSRSSDLGGPGSGYRIWVRDLQDGSTQMACKAGNAALESPVISADGRRVAFETLATNLAGSDLNQQVDVYWCDLASGEVRRVSAPITDSVNTSGTSLEPALSADGRFVAFTSDAGGLVPGDGGRPGVYWKDMETGEIRLVDASNGTGLHPQISGDGTYVAFDSDATDLPGGDLNGRTVDVFRRDMVSGTTDLVSAASGGGADGDSTVGSVSADGNLVAFSSAASNLIDGDTNRTTDAFVRNLATGQVQRVSTKPDGGQLDGPSYAPAVSGDGRFVAFASRAPEVTPGAAATARARVYRKDLGSGAVELASAGVNLAPRTLIDGPLGRMARRKARTVTGTSEDDGTVARVDVSLARSIGKGRCLWLGPRSRVVRGRCARAVWLEARLDNGLRFSLRIRHILPRGTWRLRTRATDQTGTREPARAGANSVTLKLG
jgi:Tol biopolymer transport system component/Ca2+-binding RTX toxin-like protein